MASGLSLQIFNTKSNTRVTRVFSRFPVRIGRNPLNDLQIAEGFVSQFHAVIELHGNALMLRDLGSRNGTRMGGARAPAHEPVQLPPSNSIFSIGSLSFNAILTDIAPQPSRRPPAGGDDGERQSHTRILQLPVALSETLSFSDPALEGARARIGQQQAIPREEPPDSQPPDSEAIERTVLLPPKVAPQTAQQPKPPLDQVMRERQLETVALQAIRELAQFYLPGRARLESPEDIARFLSRVRDTLDVFLRCFVPLRDGYRQFTSEMDIRATNGQRERVSFGWGIESAQNERDLAQHLLDLNDEEGASQRAVEGTFADLMIHQLALLNAIMRGVKSLLHELSPASIDRTLGELAKQGKTGWTWGPYRFKELWQVYSAKYGDVNDGDKRTFAALFGRDFAEAYSQYRAPGEGGDE